MTKQPELPLRVHPLTAGEELYLREQFTHELFLQQLRDSLALAKAERADARRALSTARASRRRRARTGRRGSGSNSRHASR
jgi:hypothetical protein